jgi:hypothetical protein
LFGVTLEDYFVTNSDQMMIMPISYSPLSSNVTNMCAHDSCIIVPPSGGVAVTTVAEFPSGVTAFNPANGTTGAPSTPYFAALVPYNQTGSGALLVIGNSGWVGDEGSPWPAPGLIAYNNNLQFVLNCIGYLGGVSTQRATNR